MNPVVAYSLAKLAIVVVICAATATMMSIEEPRGKRAKAWLRSLAVVLAGVLFTYLIKATDE